MAKWKYRLMYGHFVMDFMFMSPQNSCIETLTSKGMSPGGGALD